MKKFLKKNIIIKTIAIVLVIATVVGIALNENLMKSNASSPEEVTRYDDDEEYASEKYANAAAKAADVDEQEVVNVEEFERSDGTLVVTSYRADGSKIEAMYSDLRIMKKYYNNDNESFFMEITDLDQYTDELMNMDFSNGDEFAEYGDDETDEYDDYDEEEISRGGKGKNGMKVYEWCNFKHWYQWRNNKKGLRIGCDASYNINYSKLSASKKENCKEYTSAIFDSNKMIASAVATIGCFVIGTSAAAPIVVTVVDLLSQGLDKDSISKYVNKRFGKKFTAGVAAAKVVGAIGAIISVVEFVKNRAKVKRYYKLIRTFGKKIK